MRLEALSYAEYPPFVASIWPYLAIFFVLALAKQCQFSTFSAFFKLG